LKLSKEYNKDNIMTKEQIYNSLLKYTKDGRHFTQWDDWEELENAGVIKIIRPLHKQTGIPYSMEFWEMELTPEGMAIATEIVANGDDIFR
jgi:hypothetical protein